MTNPRPPLNPRQLEVLQWISDGCPPNTMSGDTHKLSAQALKNRRLVTVSKRGGVWIATVTDAGAYYLAHDRYPNGHWRDPAKPEVWTPRRHTATALVIEPRERPTDNSSAPRALPTEQLVTDVNEAGGTLQVEQSDSSPNYEALVRSAIRFGKTPEGLFLLIDHGARWGHFTIRLQAPPIWLALDMPEIAVLRALRRPHPIVTALVSITKPASSRALRLLHALALAAEQRGYIVSKAATRQAHHRRRSDEPLLTITVRGHAIGLFVRQELDRVPHQPTPAELRLKAESDWHRIPRYDETPSPAISVEGQQAQRS
jgi:hypothetical protein